MPTLIHLVVVNGVCITVPAPGIADALGLHHFPLLLQILLFEWLQLFIQVLGRPLRLLGEVDMVN